jgi:hypothetical protein
MHIERSVEPGHHEVTFTWPENDPDRPAHAVLVRLVAVTDYAQDDGDLSCYLMQPDHDDLWKLTRRLPSTLRSSYQICPIRDEPVHGHPSEERWMQILGMGVCDPQNPAILAAGTTYGNPGRRSWPRFAVGPSAESGLRRRCRRPGSAEPGVQEPKERATAWTR